MNRYNTLTKIFFDIAKENQLIAEGRKTSYLKEKEELNKYPLGSGDYDYVCFTLSNIENELEKAALVCIVFACMALESFIYDYAAIRLTDSYAKKHLDKMDIISKYVVIPKLACGNELSRDGQSFQLLNEIVKIRNKIVHTKSKPFISIEELAKVIDSSDTDYYDYSLKAISLVNLIASEFDEMDNEINATFLFGISSSRNYL